jgi:hypothetical protein
VDGGGDEPVEGLEALSRVLEKWRLVEVGLYGGMDVFFSWNKVPAARRFFRLRHSLWLELTSWRNILSLLFISNIYCSCVLYFLVASEIVWTTGCHTTLS